MPDADDSKEPLRICVLAFMFPPIVGGSEAQAEKHARQLQALGHKVLVVTPRHYKDWKPYEVIDGLPIFRVGGIYRRNGQLRIGKTGHLPIELGIALKLWQLRHQYDVIHGMQLSGSSAPATYICHITHKPIIFSIQSAGPDKKQQAKIKQQGGAMLLADTLQDKLSVSFLKIGIKDWVPGDLEQLPAFNLGGTLQREYLKKSAAYYQVLSNRSYAYLVENGFRPEQIIRIPNGIDIARFRPAAHRPLASCPERDILCVARLEYAKGVDVLLHAWGRMMKEPAAWRSELKPRLLLVGEGNFAPHMQRITQELGIQDSVEFLGLRRDVIDLLQRSWGFVLPSRWEGMPNALLEAMACGLPCVATRVSGSEDVITDGINGLLVEPEEPIAMAKALQCMISDHDLAERLGKKARATIEHDYQLKAITERSLHLYYQLSPHRKQGSPLTLEEGKSCDQNS